MPKTTSIGQRLHNWWIACVRWSRLLSVQMTAAMYAMIFLAVILPFLTLFVAFWFFFAAGEANIFSFFATPSIDTFLTHYEDILSGDKIVDGKNRSERFLAALGEDIQRFDADKDSLSEELTKHEQWQTIIENESLIATYGMAESYTSVELRAEALLQHLKQEYARFQDEAVLMEAIEEYDENVKKNIYLTLSLLLPLGLLLLIGIVITRWITRRTVRSIRAVVDASTRVAAGDFRVRLPPLKLRYNSEEARLLAQNFNTMTTALEELESDRKNTVAAIAHELRTPLTILQGKLDLLEEGIDPLDLSHIAKLSRQTQVLSRLIDDLRTLSLAEANRISLSLIPTELVELCHDVAHSFANNAKSITVSFTTDLAEHWLELDPDRMVLILNNLIHNAIRYSPEHSTVTLKLGQKYKTTYLRVRDQGQGIDADDLQRIFTTFYRAEKSRQRSTGGTGLGLAVVAALVELQGGKVWAENLFEGGAVFTVAFPSGTD